MKAISVVSIDIIVNKSALRAHTDSLFNKFQLKLKQIRHFQILGFMYKFTHDIITRWIQGLLLHTVRHPYIQHKNSKSLCTKYRISFARTNRRKKSL